MNKRLLSFAVISTLALFIFTSISYSNKNFAPVAHTNAPGENSCAKSGCHSNLGLQQNMQDRITINADQVTLDQNFEYSPGTTYNMQFIINQAKARNGFSLTMIGENGQLAGTLINTSNDAQVSNGPGGKKYVGHINSLGVTSWEFQWTAPLDSQVITLYSIANLSNNNNNDNGDSIITKTFSFTAMADTTSDTTATGIVSRSLEEEIQIINTIGSKSVAFNIDVKEPNYFICQIYNLNGKCIFQDQYLLHSGKQQIEIPLEENRGMFFLKISNGKNSSTFKFVN